MNVLMPQLGETVAEGTVANWHKKVGDKVAVDELLFDVETDKVSMEVPRSRAGVITKILRTGRHDGGRRHRARGHRQRPKRARHRQPRSPRPLPRSRRPPHRRRPGTCRRTRKRLLRGTPRCLRR